MGFLVVNDNTKLGIASNIHKIEGVKLKSKKKVMVKYFK
jgi:hypothetical protein